MKARSAAIQGALAAAGLVAAYVTWQRPEQENDVEVVVLDVSKGDIEKLRYEDNRREVDVFKDKDGVWVRTQDKPPPPPSAPTPGASDGGTAVATNGARDGGTPSTVAAAARDGGPAAQAATSPAPNAAATDGGTAVAAVTPPAPPPPPKPHEFRANEAGEKLFDRFGPLRAVRGLGVLSDDKLKELGLADATRTIEIDTSRGPHRYLVATDPSGASSPYIKSEEDGKVYLMKATVITDLEFASSRLVDRTLHGFRDDEWNTVTISADGKKRTLVKENDKLTDNRGAAPDQLATNWHEKIWRMIGIDVLGRGEEPAAGQPEVKVRVDYLSGSKPVGFIELAQAGSETFARTEHTASWVRLHGGAADVVKERESVLGK